MGKQKNYLLLVLKGCAMGAADVVPGVSGGTIAFITGIYEELIDSIKSIDLQALKLLLSLKFADFWKKINGSFLLGVVGDINVQNTVVAKRIHTISNAYDHTNEKWQSKCSYIWKSFALRKTLHLIHYLFLSNKL